MRVDLFLGADVCPEICIVARVHAVRPEPALPFEIPKTRDVRLDPAGRIGLEGHDQRRDGHLGREPQVEVQVIHTPPDLDGPAPLAPSDPREDENHPAPHIRIQPRTPVLGGPYEMHPDAHHASRHRPPKFPHPNPPRRHRSIAFMLTHTIPPQTDPRNRRVRGGRKPAPRRTPPPQRTTGPSVRTGPRLLRPLWGLAMTERTTDSATAAGA